VFAADLALVAMTILWGASFLVTKELLDAVPADVLIAYRFVLAAGALAAVRPRAVRAAFADRGIRRAGLVLGAALAASFALQTFGLAWTTPARSAFLTAGYVFLVPLLGWLFARQPIGIGVGIGAALATLGLAFLTTPDVDAEIRRGDVLSLLCALGFAVHILLLGRLAPGLPAVELALAQLAVAAVLALAATALGGASRLDPRAYGAGALGGIAFLGFGCTALAYFVQTWAQRTTPAARAALIFALEPAFAAIFSVTLGLERLGALQVAGCALIGLGVLAAETLRRPAPAAAELGNG
jgi:drug/metabolite transporter (DMT)-like permease